MYKINNKRIAILNINSHLIVNNNNIDDIYLINLIMNIKYSINLLIANLI